MLYSDFLFFPDVLFPVPGLNPGYHITFSSHSSLGSSQFCDSVSDFPCLWSTWQFLWRTSQVFCRMCLNWVLSDAFSQAGVVCFWRKTTEGKCHSYHTTSRGPTINLSYHFDHLAWGSVTRFHRCKLIIFPFLSILKAWGVIFHCNLFPFCRIGLPSSHESPVTYHFIKLFFFLYF